MSGIMLGMALLACIPGGNAFAKEAQTSHSSEAELTKPQQNSQQPKTMLPAIMVKANQESANKVKSHSTFNPQGERCLDRMLPFAGAGFQR